MPLYDLVIQDVSGAPGAGDITLGAAADGGRTFAAAGVPNGDVVTIAWQDGSARGIERATYNSGSNSLTSRTPLWPASLQSLTASARIFVSPSIEDLEPNSSVQLEMFGDGSDGDLIASSGTTTLSRDTYYRNVTLSGTARINTNGFRLFISGTLDLSGATGAGPYIACNGADGGNSSGSAGGGAGAASTAGTLGVGTVGTAGATGVTGAGVQAALAAATSPGNGGANGQGGGGGSGSGGAASGARASVTPTNPAPIQRAAIDLLRGAALIAGGVGGHGGGSGGGDGTNTGRGGGGGGTGGGVMLLCCYRLITGASTVAGAIQARGGRGGNGGANVLGNAGGGGGACGAGGGAIVMIVGVKTGPVVTSLIDVNGGLGGDASAGAGTGFGGRGGQGGGCGRINLFVFRTQTTATVTPALTSSVPAAATTTAGTTGSAGTVGAVSL